MLNHALNYLAKGLSVIPLEPKGKRSLVPWTEFQSRRATEAELKAWFQKWPLANVGVVTGAISSIVVVDLDGPEGLQSALKRGLTSNIISLTGRENGGRHLWYKNPNGNVQNAVKLFPGLDIRGEGGYIVAPPSVHESGRRYRFISALKDVASLPFFPKELFLPEKPQRESPSQESWIAKALQEMKNGNIDDTLFTVCSRLRADGYSMADAGTLLQPHAERAGATPGHLEEKIQNVWKRYEPRGQTSVQVHRLSNTSSLGCGFVIHSPTNADSIKQFDQHRLQANNASKQLGLQTGYTKLDQMLKGGLKSSRLFTVAARTGVGKTNWLIGASVTLCSEGKKVLLFSTEMPYSQIWERYIQTLKSSEDFKRHKFYVCDSFAPNLERVEEAINEIKPDVFMFDHINHVSEEQRELGSFMQGLNFLRRKYDCAGIVTAQLNRSADWVDLKTGEKVTPRMSMIKGSGTIEQASSRVLLLSETRVTPEGTEIIGNLDKNDDGPKGLIHFMLQSSPYKMIEL